MILLRDNKTILSNPKDVSKVCQSLLALDDEIDQDKERFYAFHLDSRNAIKLVEMISLGTLDSALVEPREVFVRAVGERTKCIIIAHNHPSGNMEPSEEDLTITQRLEKAGEILGIKIMVHILFDKDNYISFKEKGLIQ